MHPCGALQLSVKIHPTLVFLAEFIFLLSKKLAYQ